MVRLVGFYKDGRSTVPAENIVAVYDLDEKEQLLVNLTHEGIIADILNEEAGDIDFSFANTADEFAEYIKSRGRCVGDDEFFCVKCDGLFDIEESIKIDDSYYCESCGKPFELLQKAKAALSQAESALVFAREKLGSDFIGSISMIRSVKAEIEEEV